MRFSYIDSQGKEIEVDSVESLALRIQLGAIKPDTRMYDAVADRWAPAEEHPVYRALSRGEEVDEEEVVALGQEGAGHGGGEEESPEDAEASREAGEAVEPPEDEESPEPPGRRESPEPSERGEGDREVAAESVGAPGDPLGLDFQVSVADEGEEGAGGPGEALPDAEAEPRSSGASEKLETAEEAGIEGAGLEEAEVEEIEVEEAGTRQAELEEAGIDESGTDDSRVEESGEPVLDAEEEEGGDPRPTPDVEASPAPWVDEGEALWDVDEAGGDDVGGSDELDAAGHREALEEDLADPRRRMPEWATGPVGVEDWAEVEREPETERAPPPPRKRPEERKVEPASAARPAHWDERRRARARRSRFARPMQVAGLLLLVGAVAGYFILAPGDAVEPEPTPEEAAEPVLPADQWSAMATAADRAWSDVLEEFQAAIPGYGLPYRPPAAWLDGIYLSNASDYPGVADYWNGVVETLEALRMRESALYFQYLNQHLERMAAGSGDIAGAGVSVPAGAVPRIVSVARTEYDRTAPTRDSAYRELRDLAEASLALHDLLVEREEDIVYEPFTDPQVSRDPVLEAVPADSVLRSEMNAALDRVIAAITENEIPRPITTSALFTHLLTELGTTDTAARTPPPAETPEA